MKTYQLSLAAAAAALSSVAAEEPGSELCSCTPTSYSLELNFDGTCTSTTGFESDGLEGNLCFFTEGGDPDEIAEEFGVPPADRQGRKLRNTARRVVDSSDAELKKILGNVDLSSHYEHAKQFQQTKTTSQFNRRRLQLDTKVSTVTSVTFLEQDTSAELDIINQDSTYFETALSNGDIIDFISISSKLDPNVPLEDQMDMVPGGVLMILFGVNAEGTVVQNTVAWGYNTEYCEGVAVSSGDSVGWVTLDDYTNPKAALCPGVTDAPTPSPSMKPTPGTAEPTMSMIMISKSSKSQAAFTKSAKKSKVSSPDEVDAKAEKMSSECYTKYLIWLFAFDPCDTSCALTRTLICSPIQKPILQCPTQVQKPARYSRQRVPRRVAKLPRRPRRFQCHQLRVYLLTRNLASPRNQPRSPPLLWMPRLPKWVLLMMCLRNNSRPLLPIPRVPKCPVSISS